MRKKYTINIAIVTAVVILVIAAVFGLQGSSVPYEIDPNLTPTVRKQYEEKLQLFSAELEKEKPKGAQSAILGDYYIEKARYQGYLGQLSESEKTLKEGLKVIKISNAIVHNLAKINEQMKRYDEAMKYYRMLITDYKMDQYYMDLARAAREAKKVSSANEAYWNYQKIYKAPDAEFEQWLRDNKAFN